MMLPSPIDVLLSVAEDHLIVPSFDSRQRPGFQRWDQCTGCGWESYTPGEHPRHVATEQYLMIDKTARAVAQMLRDDA